MNADQFRHAELVVIAHRWLTTRGGCDFAFCEYGTSVTRELPDALGFLTPQHTVLIEVKVSRGDFRADAKKPWRQPGQGLGDWRYYMAPRGLLAPSDLPDNWGLLEVDRAGRVQMAVPLAIHEEKGAASFVGFCDHYEAAGKPLPHLSYVERWGRAVAQRHAKNTAAEQALLYSACRRLHIKECWGILKTSFSAQIHWHDGPCPRREWIRLTHIPSGRSTVFDSTDLKPSELRAALSAPEVQQALDTGLSAENFTDAAQQAFRNAGAPAPEGAVLHLEIL